jgi:hypothetical protein
MAGDLQLSNDEARRFRAVIRNGFMHQGMGLAGPTQWATSHIFTERPRFQVVRGVSTICLDPWKFADRVLREFQMRPELIAISESFPLATITTFEKSDFETVPNNSVEPTPEKRRGSR